MSEIKFSGVDWIGYIPMDWECVRLRFLCNIITGNKDTINRNDEGKYPFYVRSPKVEKIDTYSFDGKAILMAGDGVGAGKVFHYADGKFDFHQRVYNLHNFKFINAKLLYYYLHENFYKEIEQGNAKSTVDSIRLPMILDFPIVFIKDNGVQQRITDYLDQKCEKIESCISKQTELIKKLKDYKQSVITEAVTKGLDKNIEMKDSGIDWVGDIPVGWDVKRLRYVGKCQNGISKSGNYFGSGYPFVSYGDVYKNDTLPLSVEGLVQSSENEQENFSVIEGDVFFTRTSETIEEIGLVSTCLKTIEKATFAGFLIRFRPNSDMMIKDFSKYYFKSSKHRMFLIKEMNLVTRASLSQGLLKRLPVLLPNLEEQQQIANYLDNKCFKIDKAIQDKQKIIDRLAEYKKSLIYEVVTGKVEV